MEVMKKAGDVKKKLHSTMTEGNIEMTEETRTRE